MTLPVSEQLLRLSTTLRGEVGPAVGDEYTRTQAFMASVILERLAKQVDLQDEHLAAENAEVVQLHHQLGPILANSPDAVARAAAAASASGSLDALGPLLRELYSWGADEPAVAASLALIRPVLRADIDRRMEIAR